MIGFMAPDSTRKLHVGITIGLQAEDESLWTNGIKQNAVFLAEALRHCAQVETVSLVNTTPVAVTSRLPWDLERWPTVMLAEALDTVDVLVELGGQVDAEATRRLHDRGAKLVSYCCGFEYVHAMEAILFDRPLWGLGLFVNREYDDIWMVPQVANISGSYFTTLRRRPARSVPFVWDPVFLEQRAAGLPDRGMYSPRPGPRRIGVIEANLDVVKFCFYPALIADLAYRRRPEAIALLQVANAERLAAHSNEFQAAMRHLDLVRDGKAVFLGTHPTPEFLAERCDAVVSHQWENPLNYLYLEVCWQGYPFVHNAHLCADLGYFYRGSDVDEGCDRLLDALERHDADAGGYRERQRDAIARFLPSNPEVTRVYSDLLESVVRS